MPLQEDDIKIFKSDTMEDTVDGGGEATLSEVISGISNNMFDDVSTLDRVFGAVHLRKIFPHAFIQSLDKYASAHTIISKLPKDEKLGINLFTTGDYHDRRPDAQSRIESYRAKGSQYIGFLLATQFKGSKVITIFQSENAPIPVISDVLYLTQDNDSEFQYVKITQVEHLLQEFTIDDKDFKRRIVTLEISQTLDYDFVGSQITDDDNITPAATILKTVVANAAKYFSARPLAEIALEDDTTIKAESIFSQVVPSSLQEIAGVNVDGIGIAQGVIASAASPVNISTSVAMTASSNVYVGSPITPNTLSIATTGATLVDIGGDLTDNGDVIGTVSYATGVISFNTSSSNYSGNKTITFIPATEESNSADTAITEITNGNRGSLYTITLDPVPRRGTLKASFRSFGNWYDLFDNGTGGMIADEEGIGTGVINYNPSGESASVTLTLSALPDVGSAIIWSWGSLPSTFTRETETYETPAFEFYLAEKGINGSTVNVTWNDGTARTATADVSGDFTGDASGTINFKTGAVRLIPNNLPPKDTVFGFAYDYGVYNEETPAPIPVNGSGDVVHNLGATNITPGSLEFSYTVSSGNVFSVEIGGVSTPRIINMYYQYSRISRPYIPRAIVVQDDGSGNLVRKIDQVTIGTINYSTGVITFDPQTPRVVALAPFGARVLKVGTTGIAAVNAVVSQTVVGTNTTFDAPIAGTELTIVYRIAGGETSTTENFTGSEIKSNLLINENERIGTSGLRFEYAGYDYIDAVNSLVHSNDLSNGNVSNGGTINKSSGEIVLTDWNVGVVPAFNVESISTNVELIALSRVVGRVPNAPVRLNSFQIRANPVDGGATLVGDADASGNIVGTNVIGTINYETGVYEVRFGALTVASGNEDEYWYESSEIDLNGDIFEPIFVESDTIVYDAVSQTFIPLDASILGLNPVRLPEDGRVPIYSSGDVVVVLNEAITSGTYASSTQTDLGRTRIAKLSVEDANGASIPTAAFDADLDTGLIDWNDLTGITQPLSITHRIEDSVLVTDVQITGELKLSQPLTHDYPLEGTLISNAVLHGDVFAFVNQPFDQQTWTGEWSDTLIGNQTLAQFNDAAHPIIVDNASAIAERWLVQFTNSNTVNIIGEFVGQVITGASIGSNIAPINPATGFPYFTINPLAWGVGGWSSGNVLRFNTQSANVPLWVIQSVGQGEATNTDEDALTWCLEFRGDRDTVIT